MGIETSPGAVVPHKSPVLWWGAGVLVLVSLAAAAAVALRPVPAEPQMVPLSNAKPALEATTEKTGVAAPVPSSATKPAAQGAARAVKPAPRPAKAATEPVRAAAVCSYCGVVESVLAVQRKGQGSGVGAIAGGVLGAAVGNQVGGGNGRTAMTVLGAVGGGLAGHEVEKRARAETVFQVRVRFDDGTVRTLEQSSAPKVGARVEVHGSQLKTVA
jgi:outer membrane lipoprotein SlyB